MSDQKKIKESRRRLIKMVAGSGGILVGAKVAPKEWTKPIVNSVVLPAHAQTTPGAFTLTCEGSPPNGSTVPLNGNVLASVTISPTPPAGESVFGELFCDGSSMGTFLAGTTDGSSSGGSGGGPANLCAVGEEFRIRFTFLGASASCFWTIGPPT